MPQLESLSPDRIRRLLRFIDLISKPKKRRRADHFTLRVSERTLFRDVSLLRDLGLELNVTAPGQYGLTVSREEALEFIPCPDPHLNLGELIDLASQCNGPGAERLREVLKELGLDD